MADPVKIEFLYVSRRPEAFRVVNERPVASLLAYRTSRLPPPSVPQFSGTLFPARVQLVSLMRAGQEILETVQSDVAGYFEFRGWYYPHDDYEFLVHGDDLYRAQVFDIDTPIEHRWNGNPAVNDSTDLT